MENVEDEEVKGQTNLGKHLHWILKRFDMIKFSI